MDGNRIFLFWGLVLMVVPLAASGLGGGEGRADRFFIGACVPVTFVLVAFVPRMALPPAMAVMLTLAFSGVVAAAYLAVTPRARRTWPALVLVLALVDAAALEMVYLGAAAGLGLLAFAGLLLVTTAVIGAGSVWIGRRLLRVRETQPR